MIQERVPKQLYQLQLISDNEQALQLCRAVLLNLGFTNEQLVSSSLKESTLEIFDEEKIKIERTKELFDRLKLKGIKVTQKRLSPKDWLTRWKDQWKPAALTRKLDVVPAWYKERYKRKKGRDFILMDTLLSFGTGLHETTQIMSQFIEDNAGQFNSFLDIGTGTGILGFVAIKNGAKDVMGIDIGQLSVEAALDNMKANKIYFEVKQADIKKFKAKHQYDFVAANLITEDLIANAPTIMALVKPQGLLAVSGISLENLAKLRQAFSKLPLKCLKINKAKQWSGLLYQKSML